MTQTYKERVGNFLDASGLNTDGILYVKWIDAHDLAASADASLASKDAEIARLREVVYAVPKTSGPLWGDCDTVLTALRMLPSCPKKMVALQAAARIRRALFPEADAARKKG